MSIMLETAQDKLDVVGQPATSLRFCIKNKSKTSLSHSSLSHHKSLGLVQLELSLSIADIGRLLDDEKQRF